MPTETNPPPIKQLRVDSIEVSVWKNVNEDGKASYATTFQRSYRLPEEQRSQGDDGWRKTTSLRRSDLILLQQLLTKTFWAILDLEASDRESSSLPEADKKPATTKEKEKVTK